MRGNVRRATARDGIDRDIWNIVRLCSFVHLRLTHSHASYHMPLRHHSTSAALPLLSNFRHRFPPAFLDDRRSHTYILSIPLFVECHFTLMCVHVCYDCYVFFSLLKRAPRT